ncbi:phage tail protein [Culicoidibacter larvae]|uniref:Phage tail tape measure protein n=1 Tax=Culicoidibacter larvae TaxID=2579976 RepID=A0A5R8QE51_9FIRM|nr:hypothetical protein [Culicoidibacter larvae]TLG75246.1 hypothetical protein FEZ08_04160 [Culicoidibacter larvae]
MAKNELVVIDAKYEVVKVDVPEVKMPLIPYVKHLPAVKPVVIDAEFKEVKTPKISKEFIDFAGGIKDAGSSLEKLAKNLKDVAPPELTGFLDSLALFGGLAGNAAGVVQGTAKAMKSLGDATKLSGGWIALIAIVIAAAVAALMHFWNTNEEFRNAVLGIWNSIQEGISSIMDDLLAFIGAIIQDLSKFWTEHEEEIKMVFQAIWDFIMMAMEVIWNVIVVVVETIMAIWEEHGDTITAVFQAIWDFIVVVMEVIWSIISVIVETIMAIWEEHGETIMAVFQAIWDFIVVVMEVIWVIIQTAIAIIIAIWETLSPIVMGIFSAIGSFIGGVIDTITGVISGVKDFIINAFTTAWNKVKSVWDAVSGFFAGIGDAIFGAIDGAIQNIKGMINDFVISPINFVISGINNIPGVNIGALPMLAKGGTVMSGGMAIVGEAGPEMLLQRGAKTSVIPLTSGHKALGKDSGSNENIVIQLNLDGKQVAQIVNPHLKDMNTFDLNLLLRG